MDKHEACFPKAWTQLVEDALKDDHALTEKQLNHLARFNN